ncbi:MULTISPECIES: ribosome-associated ATPase/putative transporter RbbA [Halomonadaceae]|uniref:ribosome-associated ATPase/putative transporter RbbA n=1 Tax=Halomonadaceae TaxID=28256 RepID=UPI001583765A|nr:MULTISPECIES: ribosome-associated ATPase/putative transporter RbbA [Halomonas]MDI4638517.1 ribosome-associated ATPase/putative transporter RbbA [Halomonas sp. BMC7]NUJ59503.1 ribosome-associated ATPase/putative transporter RbbA [Halomonas taeanensis]
MTDLNDAVASLDGVCHRYQSIIALDNVSLTIPSARMVGVVGPDGVGKSTLLGLMAGVRRLQVGKVTALGGRMDDAQHRAATYARIAYMPQGLGRNLYHTLSVRENVDFFARLYGQSSTERAARITMLLRSTGLEAFADRPAGKLSGGMKQKLALCCALIHDPDLLILDEPTTGVDPLSRQQFWQLIERIRERRPTMSVITATAYMSEAERFDQLIAMNAGRVLAEGTPEALKLHTATDTLEAAFIALLPEKDRQGHRSISLPPRGAQAGPPAIEAQGLTMRFGDFTAVDHVSFCIESGEIFGFLGSNGCGKTTTMKMLTGLLTASEGSARLMGKPLGTDAMATRRRVGYMSQSFSLYSELSVRRNLVLHADLFHLPKARRGPRVAELIERFDLGAVAESTPDSLPLGVRQRLQLAVAVLHAPELLILDEPTSGVDPVARDAFWALLIELSRKDGVTIFISTHFMNEAERCDRISLMHAGKVLAQGEPDALRRQRDAQTLEGAFISYLQEAGAEGAAGPVSLDVGTGGSRAECPMGWLSVSRIWAFARREAMEVLRDPIRLVFALFGPIVLMVAMGYGITFDVENLSYAALDQDQSQESRMFLEAMTSSRYFDEQPALADFDELDRRMKAGDISLAVVIPPDYGRDLLSGRVPQIGAWLDGSNTTRAETGRGYVQGVLATHLADLAGREGGEVVDSYPASVEPRLRYNQAFLSQHAIPPGVLMMLLIMIPAMLTALSVVREKEMGSILNLYAAPVHKIEFLLGKQLPYIGVAMVSFVSLVVLMMSLFGLGMPGSLAALVSGAVLFTTAATAFGLVVSTFVRSQIAAIFATAIIVMIPTINFSGMMYPVSTLEGGASLIGKAFPALYFQQISAGVFNKGLDLRVLYPNHLLLGGFCVLFWVVASALLRKQEL